jgi:UDP-glucose 4-epimerase
LKVLVTGGAGFIGSHIVDALIEMGNEVVVVDNLTNGKVENIHPKARFYKMDIRDKGLEDLFSLEKPELVSHHAAQANVRRSVEDPMLDADVNILGSIWLMELSVKYGVRKIIYSSSGGAIYGEPKYLPVDENHPIEPLSHYGVSKHTVEHYISLYGKLYGIPFTILRYPNVYGPRQDPRGEAGVVAIFSETMLRGERPTIFGDGTKTRDYVHVRDIVKANLICLERGDGGIFNLGWGEEVSDQRIFELVRDAVGVDLDPIYSSKRPGEVDRICLDARKAGEILGWKPTIRLEDGISETVEFYRRKILS